MYFTATPLFALWTIAPLCRKVNKRVGHQLPARVELVFNGSSCWEGHAHEAGVNVTVTDS